MPDQFTFGPFQLDLRRRILLRNGRPVHLGSRATDLLCELVRAQGEMVGKHELMARVWPNSIVEENNLQVQVSNLRKLLAEEGSSADWLQTVPGRGYRFVPPASPGSRPPAEVTQAVRFVQAPDGVRLAAAATGAGMPLVRTGMWMTHLEHDWKTQVWGPLQSRLAASCRLVRYDQRGTGLSDRDVGPLRVESLVTDLQAVVEGFELDRFALLGISQGVPTAIEFAARHPERVTCLVLVGGYAQGWRMRGDPAQVARGEAMIALTQVGWGQNNPAFRQVFTSLAMPDASAAETDAFNELQRLSASPEVAAQFVGMVGTLDASAALGAVRAPTLVLHSSGDAWVPVALGRAVAAAIPRAEFEPIDSRSHVVMPREPAWEPFVQRVLAFVEAHSRPR